MLRRKVRANGISKASLVVLMMVFGLMLLAACSGASETVPEEPVSGQSGSSDSRVETAPTEAPDQPAAYPLSR